MFYGVCLFALLTILLYYYSTKNIKYWRDRNVKFVQPPPFFINLFVQIFQLKTITERVVDICNRYPKEKMVGFYIGVKPCLIVTDPSLLKHICILDFDHFSIRTKMVDENNPMYKNLFHGDGDTFRLLKRALSPAFTTGKLKKMFPLIIKCADKLQILGDKIVERGGIIKGDDLMSRFTIDFIASCGMGLEFGVLDENNESLFEFASSFFHISTLRTLAMFLQGYFPFIRKFNTTFFICNKKVKRFVDIVKKVCEARDYKSSGRQDFVDLLLDVAALGKLRGESMDKKNPDGSPALVEIDLSDPVLIAAQVQVFFSAGFETSSSATSYALHQLAVHPDVQKRVQNEIDEVLSKYDNKLCYDAISELALLHMVFLESMRMFPPGGVLGRVCTKKYTFPGTSTTIDPDIEIFVPVAAMNRDERYFKNPEQFQPERFSQGYKERIGDVYLPFGMGKKMCIGSNLGLMQSITGLAAILQRFTVELAPTSSKHIKADRHIFYIHKAEGGLPIKLVPRNLET